MDRNPPIRNMSSLKPQNIVLKPGAKKLPKGVKGFSISEVEDPYVDQPREKQKLRVVQRTSDNPLLEMLNRKRIDQAQFLAGYKYMAAYLICTGQTGAGIDYARQRVDYCSPPTTLTEKQINAQDLIRNANQTLLRTGHNQRGEDEAVIRIQKIAGEGLTVTQYCWIVLGLKSSKSISKQMTNLRDDLSVLAKYWGFEGEG